MIIYVYDDYGTTEFSTNELFSCMQTLFPSDEVIRVRAEEIREGILTGARYFAIGGGFDCGYLSALGNKGCDSIRDFVQSGGTYVGICAGAYFASNKIEFDLDGPLEVKGERPLKFFSGRAVGPLNNFRYNNEDDAIAIEIDNQYYAYLNGGCYFDDVNDEKYEILAKYKSNNKAAIIKTKIGLGEAILSGVHIEFNPKHLDLSNDNIRTNVFPKLLDYDYEFLRKVLT